MKNILFVLSFAFGPLAIADILPAANEPVIVSELQCSTAVNPRGTHDIIRSAKTRSNGVVDRCAGETCELFREISLRRSEGGIDVVCGDCERPVVFGRIVIDSKLEASFSGPAKYARLNEDGSLKKEHALNCRIEIAAKAAPAPEVPAAPVQISGAPKVAGGVPQTKNGGEKADSWIDGNFWEQPAPKPAPRRQKPKKPAPPKPSVTKPSSGSAGGARMQVCPVKDGVRVRTADLSDIAFEVEKGDPAILVKNSERRSKTIGGKKYDFVEAQFPDSKNRRGWIAENLLKAKCDGSGTTVTPKPKPQPEPPVTEPDPEPQEPAVVGGKLTMSELIKPNCARSKILSSAKSVVRRVWGNRSNGGGQCALGVRQSLQASKVGGIQGGIGHAADFINRLKGFGYVDTGIRDPKKAPAGSVIVLGGPNTKTYFKTGRMSRPYGDWVGHVTIKGDDGFYYTDGKTSEVAIGWSDDKNRRGTRNIIGVFVPGSELVLKHRGTCDAMK